MPYAYAPAPQVASWCQQQQQQPVPNVIPKTNHKNKDRKNKDRKKNHKNKDRKQTTTKKVIKKTKTMPKKKTAMPSQPLEPIAPAVNLDSAAMLSERFKAAKSRTLSGAAAFTILVIGDTLSLVANKLRADVAGFLAHDALHHGKALSLWPALILSAFPELGSLVLDLMLVSLVLTCLRNRVDGNLCSLHDMVEYSAGSGMLTLQCLGVGLSGVGLDKIYSADHDNTSPYGLKLWINEMLVTKRGSLNWFGTQCSSFSALCRHTSQRWHDNLYWGDESRGFVCDGNTQMVITSLLMMLSYWCSNVPVLEQPMCSVMPLCPPLSTALSYVKATRVVTWHKAFGSASMKPLQIISSIDIVNCLKRPKPRGRATSLVTRHAGGAFTGNKKKLLQSQAYTEMFGRCVADMAKAHLAAVSGSAAAA